MDNTQRESIRKEMETLTTKITNIEKTYGLPSDVPPTHKEYWDMLDKRRYLYLKLNGKD